MKFNPTPLEIVVFLLVCLAVYVWTGHGRRLRRWWQDFFCQRRGPRNLKPKSPADCPQCSRDFSLLPHRPKLDVLPWPERKSRRGRPKVVDTGGHACLNLSCDYFAISDPAIHALVSNGRHGKQQILYFKCQACGGCRTSRFGTPLYWLKTPLSQIAMVVTALSEGVDISAATRIFGKYLAELPPKQLDLSRFYLSIIFCGTTCLKSAVIICSRTRSGVKDANRRRYLHPKRDLC